MKILAKCDFIIVNLDLINQSHEITVRLVDDLDENLIDL